MSLNLNALYKRIADKAGANQSADFQAVFIDAVNRVSMDMLTDVGVTVAQINNISGNLDVDANYYPVYSEGVAYYIFSDGQWGKEPDQKAYQKYRMAIGQGQYKYAEDEGLETGAAIGSWGS